MKIVTVLNGPFQTNVHLVFEEGRKEAVVVDAGLEERGQVAVEFVAPPHRVAELGGNEVTIAALVERLELELEAILVTHAHVDHVGGLAKLKRAFPATPIFASPKTTPLYTRAATQAAMFGVAIEPPPAIDEHVCEGTQLRFGALEFEVREAPGHSPGSVVYHAAKAGVAFVGDVIFAGSVGRVDLPGGDGPTLLASIERAILTLPDSTWLYSGHGPVTTVGRERRHNPFLQPGVRW